MRESEFQYIVSKDIKRYIDFGINEMRHSELLDGRILFLPSLASLSLIVYGVFSPFLFVGRSKGNYIR